MRTIDKIITELENGFEGSVDDLSNNINVGKPTIKKYLNILLRAGNQDVKKVFGFIPDVELLVDLAEEKLGAISSSLLMQANEVTKSIVDEIAKPELKRVFIKGLSENVADEVLCMNIDDLFDYVSDEFLSYVTDTGNGFVSIVGRLNEEIILRALKNSTLDSVCDFRRTGTQSDADIIVYEAAGKRNNLYVEVKSYHARERLLRGLQDIPHQTKVGIGFFRDPREFNPSRTQTLIDTGAQAIYLPNDTFNDLSQESLLMKTGQQQRFYRSTDLFVDDMICFVNTGKLTEYR